MKPIRFAFAAMGLLAVFGSAQAAGVSEREYKRGFADCLRGDYDQNQHGASYKRGCRAAEDSDKNEGHMMKDKADANAMRSVCRGGVIGRFNPFTRAVKIQTVEHTRAGWTMYGDAVLDDGSRSQFACIFSSSGHLKRLNASDPQGAHYNMDDEGYCPPDVSEANRYQFPGCN
jgi:hypothetical protein